jgi:hypothetical protein
MSNIIKKDITAYVELLPTQYSESPQLRKLLDVFLGQVQILEDANLELDRVSTDVNLAYGYQLDLIGKLVGAERKGKTDEEFREEILFRISINTGNGTPEDCIQYLTYVTQATDVKFWEHYPASVIMETNGVNIPRNIPNTLDNVTIAGVSVGGVITSISGEVFRGCELTDAYGLNEGTLGPYPEIELGGMGMILGAPLAEASGSVNQRVITPYPELEVGGEDMECGAEEAELSGAIFEGYVDTLDSDPLSRCIFPEVDVIFEPLENGSGEEIMACGEEEAQCANEDTALTTKGVFAEVHIKI